MLATIGSVALVGLEPYRVRVECSAGGGLPGFKVVGLPDTAVREASHRVSSAIKRTKDLDAIGESSIVLNLAPAALRKTGSGYDLPMALTALAATGQLDVELLDRVYAFGELGLDGRTRDVPGVLPVANAVRKFGGERLFVPRRSAVEASLVEGIRIVPVGDLEEAVEVLKGERAVRDVDPVTREIEESPPDLLDVRGQQVARRALEIAAAGGHHVLMVGPPGCGKSMLAHRLPSILPRLELDAALEVASIHSIAGSRAPDAPLSTVPPVEEPHHSASTAGLIGGGAGIPRPGAVSLAHRGVLFLDELLEVPRNVLDALREPLESGRITITRAEAQVRYPARVLLVAATNPCPCGFLGASGRACRCRPDQIARYRSRLSGPLLDRIDLQIELRPVERDRLIGPPDGEPSELVAKRVLAAREVAAERWGSGRLVRDASPEEVRATCEPGVVERLARAMDRMGMSARGFDRSLRVARTIADLAGDGTVRREHVDEAVAYRLVSLGEGP
ncbi:MAG: YifB family Mg chelatase-like AAA ATPase [Nitriliruptorales bacterium]|nr:YifB family Mg chelatase-like AAA ATPase [Nitriliruptorales bacterium]